jgi:hypothetical protein
MLTAATVAIATLNLWALPGFGTVVSSPIGPERVNAFCAEISRSDLRIVTLQEVWNAVDRDLLGRECGFPYSADLEDRTLPIDSGLMILSRDPILERFRLTYPELRGVLGAGFGSGEGMARKSALYAKVLTAAGVIWIGNTHVTADYPGSPDARLYDRVRAEQLRLFVSKARQISERDGVPFVLGGDWNTAPVVGGRQDSRYQVLKSLLPEASSQLVSVQCTYCGDNSYHSTDEGKLDYLVAIGAGIEVKSSARAFDQPARLIPGSELEFHFSDHYGWRIEINAVER